MKDWRVYIIHFSEKLHRCQHYIGITSQSLENRLKKHNQGAGSRITNAVIKQGSTLAIYLIDSFDTRKEARVLEKNLKGRHEGGLFCPLCRDEVLHRKRLRNQKWRAKKKCHA